MDALNRIIQKILNANPELRQGVQDARILEFWPKAVGSMIAKHARAVQLKGKTVFIAVEQSVWKQELMANKRLVLEKLNKVLNDEFGELANGQTRVDEIFIVSPSKAKPTFRRK